MTISTPIKGILAMSILMASSLFSVSIVQNMAEERCYGPAYPVIPMCQMIQDS